MKFSGTTGVNGNTFSLDQGQSRWLNSNVLWAPSAGESKSIEETACTRVVSKRRLSCINTSWRRNWGRNWGWGGSGSIGWCRGRRRGTTSSQINSNNLEIVASADPNVIFTNSITTAISRTRVSNSNTVATNEVALSISVVQGGNETARSGIRGLGEFADWEFQKIVRRSGTSGETKPTPGTITRKREGIALIAVSSGESSRTSDIGDQTSLTDITTDFGCITIVSHKLKSVRFGVLKTRKGRKIPSDFSTKSVQIGDDWDGRRVNKTDRHRISSKTKVVGRCTNTRVQIGGRNRAGCFNGGERVGSIRKVASNGLG
jgi:hypothetical protein